MNIFPLLVVIILAFAACCQDMNGVKFNGFEPRRPIKYFYHLLQLKSTFNPLLYPVHSNPKTCSSKVGPFCKLTGHKPLDQYELISLSPEMKIVQKQLEATNLVTFQLYHTIERKDSSQFLIRHSLINDYDNFLKRSMGDLSKEEILDEKIFKKKEKL